jgi:hypothetical protein
MLTPDRARVSDERIEVHVGVIRVVVEQHQPLDLGFARERDNMADRGMPPPAVRVVLRVAVLRVVQKDICTPREVIAAEPVLRLIGDVDTEARFVIGQVDDGPAVLLTPSGRRPVPASSTTTTPVSLRTSTQLVLPP